MPITGRSKTELTMDEILSRTSEFQIFMHFNPNKNWELNSATNSCFREDKNPSMVIGNRKGYISFIDWGNPEFRGDCFKFVQLLYNLPNLNSTLEFIDKDMGLGIRNNIPKDQVKKTIVQYKEPEINKRSAFIQVKTRKFTERDLIYWNAYYQ